MARGMGLVGAGSLIVVAGLIGFLVENSNHVACNNGTGLFSNGASRDLASSCAYESAIWGFSICAMVIGMVLLVVGIFAVYRSSHNRPDRWDSD